MDSEHNYKVATRQMQNLELDVVEYENIKINYGERQGMGIKDKVAEKQAPWT